MLGEKDATATIAVNDIKVASRFYESQYAGTNRATAVTWVVGDIEGEVRALKSKGVAFEHYELPGMTRQGDVHVTGRVKAAWFKDSDGNILALVS
jgi:hypothetical protein